VVRKEVVVNINTIGNVVTELGGSYLKVQIGNLCSIDWGIPGVSFIKWEGHNVRP